MDCFVNGGIFFRANGSISCGCDIGALTTLHGWEPASDYCADIFLGKRYQRIRDSLRQNKWPLSDAICSRCALLHADQEFNPACADDRIIEMFHLEPSYACVLECPSCLKIEDRKKNLKPSDAGHLLLAPAALDKVLDDLNRGGITVRTFVLEGHGEPLLNRNAWDMIANIRRRFPDSGIRLITNCNVSRFGPRMLECGLDELVFAIDGVDHETYSPYRIKESFQKAFQFMSDFSRANVRAGSPVRTIWKYVVFEHNDQDEHLLRAQRLAKDVGVHTMMFILTRLGPVSRRVYELQDIPLLEGGIPVVAETNVLSLEEFRRRVLECCTLYLSMDPTEETQSQVCELIARWTDDDNHRQLKQYGVFKELLELAARTDRHAYGRVAVIHDRLLREGVFKPPGELTAQLLADGAS
ncbi:MAG: hypothetical protein V2A76_06165 [Planctomycetota bacterium]